jgi:hypothetical protein
MLQDRNIHRDAQALRKSIAVPLIAPAFGVDQDEPMYVTAPRYNWRLGDLYGSQQSLATADLIVKAQAVGPGNALGSPQLSQGSAVVTFGVEEFWWRGEGTASGSLLNKAATAALAFGANGIPSTILDGFWGVYLIQIDESGNLNVFTQAAIMAFATEEIALENCPKVRELVPGFEEGRVAILTINAVGGDFIAGTTNTDAALVAAFNTAPQDGHVLQMSVGTRPTANNSVLGQQLKDASGENILQGRGSTGVVSPTAGANGDLLCLSVRSAGAPVLVGAQAIIEWRPWPAGGEGLGDTSVSQNRPSFVP